MLATFSGVVEVIGEAVRRLNWSTEVRAQFKGSVIGSMITYEDTLSLRGVGLR
jgi:hypothetical protein